MGLHEGREKMVAAPDSHNAPLGWNPYSCRPKLGVVALYLCSVLKQALYIDINPS